jgi:long-chain acyl-CoA synthetase
VLNRIYQAVLAQLDGPGLKGSLARKALQTKLQNLKTNGTNTHFLWDRLVFNKVKQALGGRVRIIGSGSAPISPDVISFLKVAFITQVAEGYGSVRGFSSSSLQTTLCSS